MGYIEDYNGLNNCYVNVYILIERICEYIMLMVRGSFEDMIRDFELIL